MNNAGQDVFIPWVLSKDHTEKKQDPDSPESQRHSQSLEPSKPQVFHRYYHLFAEGELIHLARSAAEDMGLELVHPSISGHGRKGIVVAQTGWERSNYYVELERWER